MVQDSFILMKNISKTFPGVKALNNVFFEIKPGEVHALVGENGAGKSTLIKILAGVQQPDEGASIYIDGEEVCIQHVSDAVKKGIAVIYQDFSLFPNLTVAENIMISQVIEKNQLLLKWNYIETKAKEALEILGATDIRPSMQLENLSIAKQQMVAIAGAIAQDAKMIIMDEPTSALSKGEVQNLFKIIETLKKKGIAILFISHKLDELFAISDRFTVLRDGEYVGTCNRDETDEEQLISMMVGRKVNIKKYTDADIKDVILEVQNLSKEGNFKNISFALRSGEVLGITGLVGAGRSELMQAIFGMNSPYEGKILIKGKEVKIQESWDAKKVGIAYIPESRQIQGLIMQKSVSDNIALPILSKLLDKRGFIRSKKQEKVTNQWIKKMDIRPPYPHILSQQLSGGNQQKVVLAKWLATEPEILIVDEPTNGVDIGAKAEIHRILRELAKQGAGIIVVSSELPEILSVSDRILVMRKGRISGEFINKDVTQEMIMNKAVPS